ncbi:MAG: hypothetical protein ACI9XC_001392 [Gammaproteobacteria bacterium]|jgi:hypothetical protein
MLFEFSQALWLFLILLPIFWILKRSEKRTLGVAAIYKGVPPESWHFNLKLVLIMIFISSLIFIAARPYAESTKTGNYLFLIDVSRSMDARHTCGDLTFLNRSKNIMREVLSEIPEARFGIVVFDRFAFPITQMTNNFDYLNEVIDKAIHIGMTFEATKTELANALRVIAEKKTKLPDIYGNVKKLILISDGFVSGDYRRRFSEPLSLLRNVGVEVMVVGIGNPGETPIMSTERNQCVNENIEMDGETVLIQMRDDVLKFIAAETKGQFFAETNTEGLIQQLRLGLDIVDTENDNSLARHRNDITSIFLIMASLSLFGLIALGANLRKKYKNNKLN